MSASVLKQHIYKSLYPVALGKLLMNHQVRLKHFEVHVCLITGSHSPIYEKLNFLLASVMSRNLPDLRIYKGLYEGRNRAENCKQ